jgi:hypothetical protein
MRLTRLLVLVGLFLFGCGCQSEPGRTAPIPIDAFSEIFGHNQP